MELTLSELINILKYCSNYVKKVVIHTKKI